jgi:hypothetical protein
VKVNDKHGSFSSLASSDKSYSPAASPRHGRKKLGKLPSLKYHDIKDKELPSLKKFSSLEHEHRLQEVLDNCMKFFRLKICLFEI